MAGLDRRWNRRGVARDRDHQRQDVGRLRHQPPRASRRGKSHKVAIADQAEVAYCTPRFKEVLERVLHSCGLAQDETRRGCKPADVKTFASISDADFNELFTPLKDRGAVILFDEGMQDLDAGAKKLLEDKWFERKGARYFFVVARASKSGNQAKNRALSHRRANTVMFDLDERRERPGHRQESRPALARQRIRAAFRRTTAAGRPRARTRNATRKPSTGARSRPGWIAGCGRTEGRALVLGALLALACDQTPSHEGRPSRPSAARPCKVPSTPTAAVTPVSASAPQPAAPKPRRALCGGKLDPEGKALPTKKPISRRAACRRRGAAGRAEGRRSAALPG